MKVPQLCSESAHLGKPSWRATCAAVHPPRRAPSSWRGSWTWTAGWCPWGPARRRGWACSEKIWTREKKRLCASTTKAVADRGGFLKISFSWHSWPRTSTWQPAPTTGHCSASLCWPYGPRNSTSLQRRLERWLKLIFKNLPPGN